MVEYPRAATAASATVITALPSSPRRAQHLLGPVKPVVRARTAAPRNDHFVRQQAETKERGARENFVAARSLSSNYNRYIGSG